MEGFQFLKNKFQLQKNEEVQRAVKRSKIRTDEKVPQTAEAQIENYLKRFEEIVDRNDLEKRNRGIRALKEILHKHHVVDHVPPSYLELQRRIMREAGRGTEVSEEFSEEALAGYLQTIQEEQRASLDRWIDQLAETGDEFPSWAKYWALRSMLKMGPYDRQKHEYSKRTKNTAAPFPDLNQEALAVSVDYLLAHISGKKINNPVQAPDNPNIDEHAEQKLVSDADFQKIIDSQDFSKYYAFAMEHVAADNSELFKITEGEWRTYPKGSDPDPLVQSIQGHGTGWCTAGRHTAAMQLAGGDFHVYYSLNNLGEPTIPRLAILMHGDGIEEVRGVSYGQEIDPYISPVLDERLKSFGKEGEYWRKKAADMKLLTLLTEKQKQAQDFSVEELRFLWEIDHNIEGFGYEEDPRIKDLRKGRDELADVITIFPNHAPAEDSSQWLPHTELLLGDVTITTDTILPESLKRIHGTITIESGNNDLALKLLDIKQEKCLKDNISKFSNLKLDFIKRQYDTSLIINALKCVAPEELSSVLEYIVRDRYFNDTDIIKVVHAIPEEESERFARIFYEAGKGDVVIKHYKKFFPDCPDPQTHTLEYIAFLQTHLPDVSDQVFVESVFDVPKLGTVHESIITTINSYNITDVESLVRKLVWYNPKALLKYLHSFPSINQMDVLNSLCPDDELEDRNLIDSRVPQTYTLVAQHIDAFSDIDPQIIIDRLLQYPRAAITIVANMHRYQQLAIDHNSIAGAMLELDNANDDEVFEAHIHLFRNLSSDIAKDLISDHKADVVFQNIKSFVPLEASVVMGELEDDFSSFYLRVVVSNIERFRNLDRRWLFEQGMKSGETEASIVLSCFSLFQNIGISPQEAMERALQKGYYFAAIWNLKNFENLDQHIIDHIITKGNPNHLIELLKYAGSYKESLDFQKILTRLFLLKATESIIKNIELFKSIDETLLATELIANGQAELLAAHAKKFKQLDVSTITDMLKKAGHTDVIARNVDILSGVNHQQAAEDLIKGGKIDFLLANLEKYSQVNHAALIDTLIDRGESWKIIANIVKFIDVDHESVAKRLISKGKIGAVAQHIEKLTQLTADFQKMVAEQLIDGDKGSRWLVSNIGKFTKLSEEDKNEIVRRCR